MASLSGSRRSGTSGEHPAPRPVQGSTQFLDRHYAISRVLVVTGEGRKVVCRSRICVTDLLPRVLVDLHLDNGSFSSLAEALAPVGRLAAAGQ